MKKLYEGDPLSFALGATSVGFLLGLIVPVTRLERERLPAAVDAVRSTLQDGGSGNGSNGSNGSGAAA